MSTVGVVSGPAIQEKHSKECSMMEYLLVMDKFKDLSGLQMNREKTQLFTAGITPQAVSSISTLGFSMGSLPVRYLGLPLMHRRLRTSDYSPLLDKIRSRFNHWTMKPLFFAGRLQLIKSVIYSLVNFWLTAFTLPKCCLSQVQSLCFKFLWSGSMEKRGNAKVSWANLCYPKSEGGLGLRDLVKWNVVLNLKLVWFIVSGSDSLWVAWVKAHYLRTSNFWSAEPNSTQSWLWRSLLVLRPVARKFLFYRVGDGCLTSYWFDHWTHLGPLLDFVGERGPQLMGIPITATVSQALTQNGWRLPSFHSRNVKLQSLQQTLLHTTVPRLSQGPDKISWGSVTSSSSRFSTRRTWSLLRPVLPKVFWFKAVWFKGAIPKHSFNFWVCHLDKLPVRTRLLSWGLDISPVCCLCNLHPETRDYLMLHCEVSSTLWFLALRRLGLPQFLFHDWNTLISWLLSSARGFSTTLHRIVSHALVYAIWMERNSRLFQGISTSAELMFRRLDRLIRDQLLAFPRRHGGQSLLSLWLTFD